MVAIVDREGCIGCTLCTGVCPEVFQMEDGLAQGGPVPTGLELSLIHISNEKENRTGSPAALRRKGPPGFLLFCTGASRPLRRGRKTATIRWPSAQERGRPA